MKRHLLVGFILFVIYNYIFALPAAVVFHSIDLTPGEEGLGGVIYIFPFFYMLIGIGVMVVANLILTLIINKLSQQKRPFFRMWGTSTLIFAIYLFIDFFIIGRIPGAISIFG